MINPTPQEASFQSMRARIAELTERLAEVEKERDAARAEANHLRKIGALLEARCLGAERVRDDLEAALEKIRDHDGVSYRFGDEIRAIARAALSDHQTGATQGPPNPNSGRDRLQAVLAEIRSDISDHQTGLTSDEQTAMSKALRRSGKVVGKVAAEGDE